MTAPVRVTRATPLYLTGNSAAGWVLHVGCVPLLEFHTYAAAKAFMKDVAEHLAEIEEAEAVT